MGKFTGLLLASDYDNTLTYTEEALRLCRPMPPVSKANQAAIRYFMAEGGIFSVATGRAKPAFEAVADGVPMNGPTVLFNGAAIYDFATGKYLCEAFLPETARAHIAQTIRELPFAAVELYHDNNDIHALQPNDVTRRHLHVTHSPTVIVDSMEQVPSPISKALFSTEPAHQAALLDYLRGQGWYGDYEIVASSESLVELTARGANKGGMVRRLADLLDYNYIRSTVLPGDIVEHPYKKTDDTAFRVKVTPYSRSGSHIDETLWIFSDEGASLTPPQTK